MRHSLRRHIKRCTQSDVRAYEGYDLLEITKPQKLPIYWRHNAGHEYLKLTQV